MPNKIRLASDKYLVYDWYPYEPGSYCGKSWRLTFEDGSHNRFLDEFETDFVDSAIRATRAQPHFEEQPDGSVIPVDTSEIYE